MIKLDERNETKEYLDHHQDDTQTLRQTYFQIDFINRWTLGYWPLIRALKRFLSPYTRVQSFKVLDIGCGNGELLRQIHQWAQRENYNLQLTGIDINPSVIADNAQTHIRLISGNVLDGDHEMEYDIILSSLTMHHLSNEDIVRLMQWMSSHARIGWFICDLDRSPWAYYLIKCFVTICRCNHWVRHDAPLSVARGFQRKDWERLLAKAGIEARTVIQWYPNFRYGIRYERTL